MICTVLTVSSGPLSYPCQRWQSLVLAFSQLVVPSQHPELHCVRGYHACVSLLLYSLAISQQESICRVPLLFLYMLYVL
jgi:hypothetical protein